MPSTPHEVLERYFGYSEFRPFQLETIETILQGQDVVTVLPTGGGKSVCYQIPALLVPQKVAVIISPLLALIEDQVRQLKALGLRAESLTSLQESAEKSSVFERLHRGEVDLLYLSPEKLLQEEMLSFVSQLPIHFFAIDEAHCVSIWGHEFRDSYRNLGILKQYFPDTPIACFTATATDKVAEDIVQSLSLQPRRFLGSFARKNLYIQTQMRVGDGHAQLMDFLKLHREDCGIVYCLSRKECEVTARALCKQGFSAEAYHAGLPGELRRDVQRRFDNDETKIVVATIAFGMGVHKSNIRFVVHMRLPKSIEDYYQEIGRAGRDGEDSECLLLYARGDVESRKEMMLGETMDESYRERAFEKMETMYRFALPMQCRHSGLLRYFGEESSACGDRCDYCKEPQEMSEVTQEAKMFLSAIYRLNQSFGKLHVIDVLRGSKNKKVLDGGHDRLSVYGVGMDHPKEFWLVVSDFLLAEGLIRQGEFKVVELTQKGAAFLRGGESLSIPSVLLGGLKIKQFEHMQEDFDQTLFEKLRELRMQIAKAEEIPPYVVFDDKTLKNLCRELPQSHEQMLNIKGVGEVRLEKYGQPFLEAIAKYMGENPAQAALKDLGETYRKTFALLDSGLSPKDIAKTRELKLGTVVAHIRVLAEAGAILPESAERCYDLIQNEIPDEVSGFIREGFERFGVEVFRENVGLLAQMETSVKTGF